MMYVSQPRMAVCRSFAIVKGFYSMMSMTVMYDMESVSGTLMMTSATSISGAVGWPYWPLQAAMNKQTDIQSNVFLM